MSSNCPNITSDVQYDDGVVYFGPVAESELERHKKLPRFTVVPSDIILSHSYFDSVEDQCSKNNANDTKCDRNDQSTLNHLDESKENTTVHPNNSTNVTLQTINFDEEKNENVSFELKQSSSKYSTSSFSSPCASKFFPSDKLIETEVINRYIRMETMSPDESFSDVQNRSKFEGETVSNVDDKEESIQENFVCDNVGFTKTEVMHENSANSEISANPCESVSNVINLCNNENEKNVSDAVNNVCTLKYHSQEENNESMCSDADLGDTTEDYSIVADKYIITPGKQRLFDMRSAKPSFHARSCSVSVPFMDRIEETTLPIVPKNLNSHSVLNNVSYIPSDTKENLEASLVNVIGCNSSAMDFNHINDMPDSNVKNVIDSTNKSIVTDMEVELTDISVEDKRILDTSKFTINQGSTNKSMNIIAESLIYQNHVSNEKKPVAVEIETKLVNTSVVNAMSNDSCTTAFLTKSENIQFNKSLNNPNVCVDKFDFENSTNVVSNTIDLHKSVNKSETLAMEIQSINSSVLDATSDDIIYTNKLSTNSESIKLNESLNEANQSEYLPRTAEFKFDLEESVITKPNLIVPAINDKEILLNEKNTTNIDVNCSEKPSSVLTQYLNFDQSQIENCNNINSTLNEFEDYQSKNNISITEQTICSETTDLENKDNSFSIFEDDHIKSKLSVIIENRTLEEEIMVQNDDAEKVVEDMSSNSVSKNVLSEDTNNEMLIELAKDCIKGEINHAECDSNIHEVGLSLIYVTNPLEKETEIEKNFIDKSISNSGISFDKNNDIINDCFLSKNYGVSQNETNLITEVDSQVVNNTTEQILSKDIENNDRSPNSFSKNNLTDISILNTSELLLKSESALKNIHQEHIFDITNSMSNSLSEFNKIEQMFLDEDKKEFEFKTPKTQKLLNFSVEQQSPFLVSQEKKQNLLNFSIIEQTPTLNIIQHKSFNHNSKKNDTLMDFSSVGQMLDLEIMSADEIDFQKSSSNSLMNILAPNVELLGDESIKTSSSDHSDLSFNQTITETNLHNPDNSMNQLKMNDMEQFSKKKDSIVLINKQIEVNESSNFLNKIIAQNKSCDELNIEEITTNERKHGPEHLLSTTLSTESVMDSYQNVSNKYCIQDFSIVEQPSKLKNIETITSVKSDNNASNLIDMSVGSTFSMSSYKPLVSSNIPLIVVSSHDESEKTLNSCSSDGANNTAIYFEDSQLFHKEVLTDVQMNDVSLLVESPDKSSVSESFQSIESDHHVQEDKKRKFEPLQESETNDKKMKVDAEELKTPSSMLYKIRNMFRSSEKKLHSFSNPDENNLKSNIPRQKLNFSKCEENKASFAKPSKIPCKVTDISMTKSSEFNLSTSSLNENIVKPKKTISKLTGLLPVLTDVSNSSTKKIPESRIPSKFQK